MMKHCYLEVTYRGGRPLAAYFYLPRHDGDRSARTEAVHRGFVVDFAGDGRAIGIEITSPSQLKLADLNRLLERLGHPTIALTDLAPLAA